MRSAVLAAVLLLLAGAAARGPECNVLTPADIKAVTGADVQPLPPGGSAEHGRPPFKEADGHAYLVVERQRGPDKYRRASRWRPSLRTSTPSAHQSPGWGTKRCA